MNSYRIASVLFGIGLLVTLAALIVMLLAIIRSSLVPQGIIELVDSFGYVMPFGRTTVALTLGLCAEVFLALMRFSAKQANRKPPTDE
ncbi:MAG: hypothetical protein K2X93_13945 [Candidatus Obscuribacterales bacterium]|nr:hypothetical protein [Candidatus Obscuribacterales bacterium]